MLVGWLAVAGTERDDVIGEDQKRAWRASVHKANARVGLTGSRGCRRLRKWARAMMGCS